jgi:hypothetical protein
VHALNRESHTLLRLSPHLTSYTSFVLILDATFFGKKGSDTQWGLLVAQDALTGDILASKEIFQETLEDYRVLLSGLVGAGYPAPYFCVIDGRKGVEATIRGYYDVPVQICQSHKIAIVDRYLLKYPRRESYKALKLIAHMMTQTDQPSFVWMLEKFRHQYREDFETRELDPVTLIRRNTHPRLHLAYRSLVRDIDRLFVSLQYLQIVQKNINTSNRIECVFSHLKPKVKLHR